MIGFMVLIRVLISVGAVLLIAELLFSVLWLKFYFRHGIQVYHHLIRGDLQSEQKLSDITDCSNSGFLFQSVTTQEILFRDPLIKFSLKAPVMHGHLISDNSRIEFFGLANWTPFTVGVLSIIFGIVAVMESALIALAVPVAFVGFWMSSFQAQKRRLDDLVDEITANLKHHNPAND